MPFQLGNNTTGMPVQRKVTYTGTPGNLFLLFKESYIWFMLVITLFSLAPHPRIAVGQFEGNLYGSFKIAFKLLSILQNATS